METSTLNIIIICATFIILSFVGYRKSIYLKNDKNIKFKNPWNDKNLN